MPKAFANGIHISYKAEEQGNPLVLINGFRRHASGLDLIQSPTLAITGTEDRAIKPASSEVMASRVPNAALVRVEGEPHAFFAAMRHTFNRESLDFLRNDRQCLDVLTSQ